MLEPLRQGVVVIHPWILGEIALGSLGARRAWILRTLRQITQVNAATDAEVMQLIDMHELGGTGIGWVDAHLLASALITPQVKLLTRDRKLEALRSRPAFLSVIGVWVGA